MSCDLTLEEKFEYLSRAVRNIVTYHHAEVPRFNDGYLGLVANALCLGIVTREEAREARPIFTCPVCFNDTLDSPPENHMICACCACHFNYNDSVCNRDEDEEWDEEAARVYAHKQLRDEWVSEGCLWWHEQDQYAPTGWTPEFARQRVIEKENENDERRH